MHYCVEGMANLPEQGRKKGGDKNKCRPRFGTEDRNLNGTKETGYTNRIPTDPKNVGGGKTFWGGGPAREVSLKMGEK